MNKEEYKNFYEKQAKENSQAQMRIIDWDIKEKKNPDYDIRGRLERVLPLIIGSVLDVGCEHGGFALNFSKNGHRAVGIDVSEEYLKRARKLCPEVEFIQGWAEELPFDDNSFDTVFLGEILEHVIEPKIVIDEAYRVAKQRVVITVPNPNFEKTPDKWSGHLRIFTGEMLKGLLEGKNYKFIKIPQKVNFVIVVNK
jgi:ubiquinone/menaquinone biosynthesis C-methylase UbiE